jgi:hypothetical protein
MGFMSAITATIPLVFVPTICSLGLIKTTCAICERSTVDSSLTIMVTNIGLDGIPI